jgi:CBS domain containing-hemolysin-like protein
MPAVGDHFEAGSKRSEVVDMDRNRVDKILVSEAPAPDAGPQESAEG